MARSLPPLTWLRAFEAAARHLSFTRAADELGLTQSAVSQHVRALEQQLEQQLFVRMHRALNLTEAGRLLLPDVSEAMGLLGRATSRFVPEIDRPRLRIASSASVVQHVLAPAIGTFRHTHPGLVIDLISTIWPDDFTATTADIDIRFGSGELVGHNARLLTPSHLHVVAVPELIHDLQAGTPPEMLPLIQPVGISVTWADLFPGAEPDYYVDTHGAAVDLARHGAGLALTHCLISARAIQLGLISDTGLGRWPAREGYFVARNPAGREDMQQAFIHWLDDLCMTSDRPV